MKNFLSYSKIVRVADAAAAAQTDIVGSIIDTSGFDGVVFVASLGDVAATCALNLYVDGGAAADLSDAASLSGYAAATAGAADYDNKIVKVEVTKPSFRYLRPTLQRGTANAVVDGIFAILYGAHVAPITEDATVKKATFALAPATVALP